MRQFYCLLLITCISFPSFAQKNGTLRGLAYDTLANKPVANATITIMERKDSSLVTFTMTDVNGRFDLSGLSNGEYRILLTHVSYHNYSRYFTVDDKNKHIDLGKLVLSDVNTVMNEVVIKNEIPPVTLVGDTIQYNAGSFKTQPNATVEQLLKKLPGVQVDKDGTVKAQGEKVSKVLVDGKEFFGNDPRLATKNLPADAVDKVQVYDKLSDQAQLTGFDDGNSEKTINLKLKQDKKKGLFGKATAGAGTDKRYEGKFNVNSFKGARQMSAIGMINNTNAEGFSFLDILNFTGELQRMRQNSGGAGRMSINMSDANASMLGLGNSNSGINTVWGGGFNYNNIIGKKTDFTSNYFYNRYNPNSESHIQRQYFLPDSSYFYNQNSLSDNLNNTHRVNLSADIQIDSFNSIKISPSFSYQQTRNKTYSDYSTLSQQQMLSNEGFSDNLASSEGYNFRNDLLYRRKFAKKGRTFSASLQTSLNNSSGDASLESVTSFYNKAGALIRRDSIDQQNDNESALKSYYGKLVYTEPIFKRSLLEFSAGKSNSKSTSEKTTYDFNALNGKFDHVNDRLTNDFENTYSYTNGGLRVRTQKKKYNYALGLSWQQAELEGKIIAGTKDSVISKSFVNMLPSARFQYNFTRNKTISVNYTAYTNQPGITQLQPVPDNSNPLNIREGNPNLKQEYINALQLNFNSVNPFKNRNFFAFFNMSMTQNKIVNYDVVDNFGIKTTRPVNVNGVYSLNGNLQWGLPVRFVKGTINFRSNTGYNKGRQFINGTSNNIRTLSLGPDVRIETNFTDKLNISFITGVNYYNTKYSLQSALNTTYFTSHYETEIEWQLPQSFFIATDFTYTINSQRATGFNTKVPLWDASISKQFLKFHRGELKFSVNDLLNQNIGITRNSTQNYIEDSRVRTLRRFFLLSFTYSLSKNSANAGAGQGGMHIMMN